MLDHFFFYIIKNIVLCMRASTPGVGLEQQHGFMNHLRSCEGKAFFGDEC